MWKLIKFEIYSNKQTNIFICNFNLFWNTFNDTEYLNISTQAFKKELVESELEKSFIIKYNLNEPITPTEVSNSEIWFDGKIINFDDKN